jgi:DNA-binding MurR/RpiR family transcriptional regulator
MDRETSFFQRVRYKKQEMSRSHKKIAAYLEKHPESAPFLTAAKLAEKAGVGEATVIRFATSLGYSGYTDMQKSLQHEFKELLNTVERLEISRDIYPEESRMAYEILKDDISNLQQTLNRMDKVAFKNAVDRIGNARQIQIIAFRSSYALGYFLSFYLQLICENTELIGSSDTMMERLSLLGPDDLVIGIGFPRVTYRTVQALQYVRSRKVPILVITDSHASPLAGEGDIVLTASSQLPSIVDSFTAPLSLINALITAVGQKYHSKVSLRLKELEDLWEKEGIYFID